MGKWHDIFFGQELPPRTQIQMTAEPPRQRFAVGDDYETWNALVQGFSCGTVTRAEAMSIPAIKRARDIFCSLGNLPLHCYNAAGEEIKRSLLDQPEARNGYTRSVTMANTIDDLLFYANSLWTVESRDSTGYPSVVQRRCHGTWNQDKNGTIMVDGVKMLDNDCIVFVSSNDPLLVSSAGTVRALITLEVSAGLYLNKPEMNDYFQPNDNSTHSKEEIEDFLDDWTAARKKGTTGWIPSWLDRHEVKRMTAEEMQLISAREFSIAEVARLTGINSNWLSLNVTTRTYSNAQDERRDFLDFPASPFIHAIEERLSLGSATPNGQYVKINMDGFLRSNTLDRYTSYSAALNGAQPWLTVDEVRALENRQPLGGTHA